MLMYSYCMSWSSPSKWHEKVTLLTVWSVEGLGVEKALDRGLD